MFDAAKKQALKEQVSSLETRIEEIKSSPLNPVSNALLISLMEDQLEISKAILSLMLERTMFG